MRFTCYKNKNYTHSSAYDLPVRPSPNLPNATAINLYPSLCLFEQTPIVSIGRGTEMQFQVYGHPNLKGEFSFIPQPNFGAKYPKLKEKVCVERTYKTTPDSINFELKWLIEAYRSLSRSSKLFLARVLLYLAGTKNWKNKLKMAGVKGNSRQLGTPAFKV